MRKFFRGAVLLTTCALLAKLMGALYRIPLMHAVGSEGMGIYQMVFPLYAVLVTLLSAGIPQVVCRLVATTSPATQRWIVGKTMLFGVGFGLALALLVVLLCPVFAAVQGNGGVRLAYVAIAPSLVFVGASASLRGYFLGKQRFAPSGVSQLVEQTAKLGFGLALAFGLRKYGVEVAVCGALVGTTLAEAISLATVGVFWLLCKDKPTRSSASMEVGIDVDLTAPAVGEVQPSLGSILLAALPIAVGGLVLPMSQVIDSVLIVGILRLRGVGASTATAQFGLLGGAVASIVNMPLVLSVSLSQVLLPRVASHPDSACQAFGIQLERACIFLLPAMAGFIVFSKPIITILYGGGLSGAESVLASQLLALSAASVFLVGVLQLSTATLHGLGQSRVATANLLVAAVAKIIALVGLLFVLGVRGGAVASVVCFALAATLNIFKIKCAKNIASQWRFYCILLLSLAVFVAVGYFVYWLLLPRVGVVWGFICAGGLASAIYGALCLCFGRLRRRLFG